jgi:dipeptidyl aminopeptidase/acylaminoacyl peptidase
MLILAAGLAHASLPAYYEPFVPHPDRGWAALSWDGEHLAWAEWEGDDERVVRIVVSDAEERRLAALEPTGRMGAWIRWTGDGRVVFSERDGDLTLVKAWSWRDGTVEVLAPGASSRPVLVDDGGRIVIGVEERRGKERLVRISADGAREEIGRGPDDARWILDRETLQPLGYLDQDWTADEWGWWLRRSRLFAYGERRALEKWRSADGYPRDDNHWLASTVGWGGGALLVDGHGRPADAVVRVHLDTGEEEVLFQSDGPDVTDTLFERHTGALRAVAVEDERVEWIVLDEAMRGHFDRIAATGLDFEVSLTTPKRWLLKAWSSTMPLHQLLYDVGTGEVTRVGPRMGEVENRPWRPTEAFEIAAADGLPITGYFTSPDPERFGGPPWPTVVEIHGGPWPSRDTWFLDPGAQRLAERGYATLRVNFRGSSGFGREWQERWRGEWGRKMQTDVLDGLDHVVSRGLADPERVAFAGMSYGGYAALRAATDTPERMRCAAAAAAPALLVSRHPLDIPFHWTIGSLRERREISPALHVEDLGVPVLLEQGGEDDVVRPVYANRFAREARRLGKPVTYVFWDDEGHGFARPDAFEAHWTLLEAFLAPCLGGEAGPIELGANDVRVPLGAELVPGLAEAMEGRR